MLTFYKVPYREVKPGNLRQVNIELSQLKESHSPSETILLLLNALQYSMHLQLEMFLKLCSVNYYCKSWEYSKGKKIVRHSKLKVMKIFLRSW